MAAGIDDHLTEPLGAADLVGALERAADRSDRDGTAAETAVVSPPVRSAVLDPAALANLRELAEAPSLVHLLRDAVAAEGATHRSRPSAAQMIVASLGWAS